MILILMRNRRKEKKKGENVIQKNSDIAEIDRMVAIIETFRPICGLTVTAYSIVGLLWK